MTGGACWKWLRCHRWLRGRCGPPGTQPAGKRGSSYRSRSAQTGRDGGVWVADWCSVASWVWGWEFQIPGCLHTSPSDLNIARKSKNGLWRNKQVNDYLLLTQHKLELVINWYFQGLLNILLKIYITNRKRLSKMILWNQIFIGKSFIGNMEFKHLALLHPRLACRSLMFHPHI